MAEFLDALRRVMGGDTVIGRGAVIGGNSFITYSVPPGIRVGVGR